MKEGNSQDLEEWRYYCCLSCYLTSEATRQRKRLLLDPARLTHTSISKSACQGGHTLQH